VAAKTQYVQLLSEFVPVAIETEAENERALRVVEALMDMPRGTAAESGMLKPLAELIQNFGQKHYSLGEPSSLETLKELTNARGKGKGRSARKLRKDPARHSAYRQQCLFRRTATAWRAVPT
jgi:hypothetical protein